MLPQNTRESAVRREEFHDLLRNWLDESFDDYVGDSESHAGSAWLWVRHEGDHLYLDAASTRAGVRKYIQKVEESGGDPPWSMIRSGRERERVGIGRDGQIIDGFEFYRHVPERS